MASSSGITAIVIAVIMILVLMFLLSCIRWYQKKIVRLPLLHFPKLTATMNQFLNDIEKEKPIRFTSLQLRIATDNFSTLLGSGGFGAVYKGVLSNETMVAVKVLHGTSDKRIEQQFMAEVGTIGRVHHFNLVRLYGFCFDKNLRALVYEYLPNGSLDRFLFTQEKKLGFEKLHEIAVGTAKGIGYLHEECQQRIIHYDIKPENILLDSKFCPKVADFGLAKLCNRENTHMSMTGGRGTPGYAAPELWMPYPITHKCDVYSFGMLLFEIIGRRRNLNVQLPESQEWFPRWVWKNIESNGDIGELMEACEIEEGNRETVERKVKTALWCVQYRAERRPLMSMVVKMLDGAAEIPQPSNPFEHLPDHNSTIVAAGVSSSTWTDDSESSSSVVTDRSKLVVESPTTNMENCEIEVVCTST
ncbi:hypothetical protein ERO13_A05G279000v2 [Gossypium hirsutum]|uniref:G-type lectin S-receptor-like serine/threonine-protein kinase At5g24080 n=1 Tax=Gossypium hirsutum TaxID=3635 RepID=A0A1U8J7K4_GOSHI|nr:G-type lectin S-receptor-like serine/threonine-protein kinase At5g24080 [Gossypium hirsutum]KAG4201435.1 hypothetical protein ERO13_A05G279000v2 [Gossypium hirsutum]